MVEKVTIMMLMVDLQCSSCYKKVKKLLCKFPQIRDQVYDEKQNTVTIAVVCCSPEKIRDKLCRKGGKTIKSIEIKPPPQPEEPIPTLPVPIPAPKGPEPVQVILIVPAHGCPSIFPPVVCCGPCYEGRVGGPCYHGYGRPVPCYDNYGYNNGCTIM